MLEYFSPRVLLDAGIFHPRDTTGYRNIPPQGYYWMLKYFTPEVLLHVGIFYPRGTTT